MVSEMNKQNRKKEEMNIDELTLGQIKEIKSISCGEQKSYSKCNDGLYIVVLQRGWVVVGNRTKHGEYFKLKNAAVIRVWGTDKGLGQLALEGPQSNTKLDKSTDIEYHELTTVLSMECNKDAWKKYS